jgi:spoIIIJ-associated protein
VTERTRRFFWGNSLPQAVMSAARYHKVEPEQLAYRLHDKRHGFIRPPRAVVIVVDPSAPRRASGPVPVASATAPEAHRSGAAPAPPARAPLARPAAAAGSRERRPESREPVRSPGRSGPPPTLESWEAPDAESETAAGEATRRLLKLAGLDLEVGVAAVEDRLEVTLTGADETATAARGPAFLEELEHLLPRAIHGLCGRMVRCRVDCGGQRAAHDAELRELAVREAEQVAATGQAALLEPLSAAERRVVHLALRDRPDVSTESVGSGARKRIRISPVSPG